MKAMKIMIGYDGSPQADAVMADLGRGITPQCRGAALRDCPGARSSLHGRD